MKTTCHIWMNQAEIEYAPTLIGNHPTLQPAATYLLSFLHLINEISDGWPYWTYGTKCSHDLQTIVHNGTIPCNQYDHACVKPAEVSKACKKIQTFLKRCDQTKNNPTVLQWLQDNP